MVSVSAKRGVGIRWRGRRTRQMPVYAIHSQLLAWATSGNAWLRLGLRKESTDGKDAGARTRMQKAPQVTAPKPGSGARTAESYAQEALDKRAYVVVAIPNKVEIGSVVKIHGQKMCGIEPSDATAVVVSGTNEQDMIEQEKLWG